VRISRLAQAALNGKAIMPDILFNKAEGRLLIRPDKSITVQELLALENWLNGYAAGEAYRIFKVGLRVHILPDPGEIKSLNQEGEGK